VDYPDLRQSISAGAERATAFRVFGAVNTSSAAVDPLIGGLLIQADGTEVR
jgi:hypothetical protein